MAILIPGKTACPLCAKTIMAGDETRAFPAFLPASHALHVFSDAAFHRHCFEADARAASVDALYARYRAIWDSRPKELKTLQEIDAWGREAFKDFP
jgi:hypothetical protein